MSKEDKKKKARLNFVVTSEVASSFEELSERQGKTKTAVFVSAIAFYTRIIDEVNNGSKIILRDKDGKEQELVFL